MFKEKFTHAKEGDFVVTEQEGIFSLLLVRFISSSALVLEEICVAKNIRPSSWHEWIEAKAPGHTSWTVFEIDMEKAALKESYSFSRKGWLYLEDSEYFFAKLLSLSLEKTPEDKKRRIGLPPPSGETDKRAFWIPPLIIEGKKREKPLFENFIAYWPQDGSKLAGCEVQFYFDAAQPLFPFPYWLEIKSPHYAFKARIIDSGTDLHSPQPRSPERPPEFIGQPKETAEGLLITLKSPSYYKDFHLFATDLTTLAKETRAIPCTIKEQKKESVVLKIECKELESLLISGHQYQWVVIPEGTKEVYVEMQEPFLWKTKL